jgi:hypothetical protein
MQRRKIAFTLCLGLAALLVASAALKRSINSRIWIPIRQKRPNSWIRSK